MNTEPKVDLAGAVACVLMLSAFLYGSHALLDDDRIMSGSYYSTDEEVAVHFGARTFVRSGWGYWYKHYPASITFRGISCEGRYWRDGSKAEVYGEDYSDIGNTLIARFTLLGKNTIRMDSYMVEKDLYIEELEQTLEQGNTDVILHERIAGRLKRKVRGQMSVELH